MKKIALLIAMFFAIVSCSSDDSGDSNGGGGISDNVVSGKLYGNNFTLGGGKASPIILSGVESIQIWLTAQDLGCETEGTSDFPISIMTPKAIGTHTTGVSVTFREPNSTDFISLGNGNTIEIISLTDTKIIGKIMAASTVTDNNIEGKFEISICQ